MNYKIIILKIFKENQTLGVHKLDRLFHDVVDFSISWVPILQEMREENLVKKNGYEITKKGIEYLQKNSN
ncbi:hypothetical protein [Flavobacterium dankookense]|nr:hypothetical protein [Flavobacterium dankookense]